MSIGGIEHEPQGYVHADRGYHDHVFLLVGFEFPRCMAGNARTPVIRAGRGSRRM